MAKVEDDEKPLWAESEEARETWMKLVRIPPLELFSHLEKLKEQIEKSPQENQHLVKEFEMLDKIVRRLRKNIEKEDDELIKTLSPEDQQKVADGTFDLRKAVVQRGRALQDLLLKYPFAAPMIMENPDFFLPLNSHSEGPSADGIRFLEQAALIEKSDMAKVEDDEKPLWAESEKARETWMKLVRIPPLELFSHLEKLKEQIEKSPQENQHLVPEYEMLDKIVRRLRENIKKKTLSPEDQQKVADGTFHLREAVIKRGPALQDLLFKYPFATTMIMENPDFFLPLNSKTEGPSAEGIRFLEQAALIEKKMNSAGGQKVNK